MRVRGSVMRQKDVKLCRGEKEGNKSFVWDAVTMETSPSKAYRLLL